MTDITTPAAIATPAPARPLSISALRLWAQCGLAWQKRYVLGQRGRTHARAWRGGLTHAVIQLAYTGVSLPEAVERAWEAAVGPVLPDLRAWARLDDEYSAMSPRTKAAERWLEAHPDYHRHAQAINAFRSEALGHLRWGERDSLTDFYRAARRLASNRAEDLLLASPLLVEGRPLDALAPTLTVGPEVGEDGESTEAPGLLRGELWGVPVYGVPDVVARAEDGAALVLDYKTGRTRLSADELAEDAQMALYVELLRQQGHLDECQDVRIGHRYISERGEIATVWSHTARLPRVLDRLGRQLATARALFDAGIVMPARGIDPAMGPCGYCAYRHSCEA
jgi:hypothetical protein